VAEITLYHNPNCSKSRGALAILEDRGIDFDVVEYLKEPLSSDQVAGLLARLDADPAELVRNDAHFKELGLDAADYRTAESVAELLAEHPGLMQRPVVVRGDRAVIGRPPELIEELL
jgi:arsenate reductase